MVRKGWISINVDVESRSFLRLRVQTCGETTTYTLLQEALLQDASPASELFPLMFAVSSGDHSVDFWRQDRKIPKSDFPGLIFATSGADVRKCLDRRSWSPICRFLKARPEILKSELLEPIVSISGANAGKCLHRISHNPLE